MRRDAALHREVVSRLLDEKPPLDMKALLRRSKLSLRSLQSIAKYLHRKLPRRRRTVRASPLANVLLVRRLVRKMGATQAAAQLGVSRQAIYQRLARAASAPA